MLNTDNVMEQVIAYEEGALDDQEVVAFFQKGIDEKWVWGLQGHYTRTANTLIELGFCTAKALPLSETTSEFDHDNH